MTDETFDIPPVLAKYPELVRNAAALQSPELARMWREDVESRFPGSLTTTALAWIAGEFMPEDGERYLEWLDLQPIWPPHQKEECLALGAILWSWSAERLDDFFGPRGYRGEEVRQVMMTALAFRMSGAIGSAELRLSGKRQRI